MKQVEFEMLLHESHLNADTIMTCLLPLFLLYKSIHNYPSNKWRTPFPAGNLLSHTIVVSSLLISVKSW